MISRAVFKAQGRVNRTPEQQDSLRRVFRNFRVSLAVLVFVDVFQVGVTIGLSKFPQYSGAVICITVAMFVVHCLVSNNLLKNFVKQIWSRNDGSTIGNNGTTNTTNARSMLKSRAGKQAHFNSCVLYLTNSIRSRLFDGGFEGLNTYLSNLVNILNADLNIAKLEKLL